MSYKLNLIFKNDSETKRVFIEKGFVDDLKKDYKVYLFYVSGSMPNAELTNYLKKFGEDTGDNCAVQSFQLSDKKYGVFAKTFGITTFPVIVITGSSGLASVQDEEDIPNTAYVRIDNGLITDSYDKTIECVFKVWNMFMQNEIKGALDQVKKANRSAILDKFKDYMKSTWDGFRTYIDSKNISVSLFEGKFEITHGETS